MTIVEDRTAKRICARCGATPAEVRRMGWRCMIPGRRHVWIMWQPKAAD